MLAFAALGCGKREARHEVHVTDSTRAHDLTPSDTLLRTSPSHPTAPQVGKSDSLINAIAPKVRAWAAMWGKAAPGFVPESLFFAGSAPALRKGYIQPLKNIYPPTEEGPTFKVLGADSPDGRYKLVFDWYQHIGEDSGEIEIGEEADSAPLLLDFQRGISNHFEGCGTPCGYHWGVWLSPTSFVLAGWVEGDAAGKWKQGKITIYSIGDSTATTYVTRFVPLEAYARYRDAWGDWVSTRYRALVKSGELDPTP